MRTLWLGVVLFTVAFPSQAVINVSVHLDSQHAARALVPASGGTVNATAADGTQFKLTIPSGALVSAEDITMTPVAFIENLPASGGLIGAVQLEPSGLRLLRGATLVITPSVPIPVTSEIPIAWHGGGNDIYLHPLARDAKSITFNVTHFSGAGMSSGTDADRSTFKTNSLCDGEAADMQKVYEILKAERDRGGEPPDPTVIPRVEQVFVDHFNNTLKPAMQAAIASKDEGLMQATIWRAFSLMRNMELIAGDDAVSASMQKDIYDAFAKMLQIRSDKAFDRCVKEHRPEQIITLRSIERTAQLLGLSGQVNLQTEQRVAQCGKFELHFLSTLSKKASIPMFGYLANMTAEATVPLAGDPVMASARLFYTFDLTMELGSICSVINAHGNDDTFTVLGVEFDMNPKAEEDPCAGRRRPGPKSIKTDAFAADAPFKVVSIRIDVGKPTEEGTMRCALPGLAPMDFPLSQQLGLNSEFPNTFQQFHHDETPQYTIKDWTPGDGVVLAKKTYKVDGDTHFQFVFGELTQLSLIHTPGQ